MSYAQKWADYVITAVRYEERNGWKRINSVKVSLHDGRLLSQPTVYTRQFVVDQITKFRRTFVTAFYNPQSGSYQRGDAVEVFQYNGVDYIRTVGNNRLQDNLGNLPEF